MSTPQDNTENQDSDTQNKSSNSSVIHQDKEIELEKAALKAIKVTNLCLKHMQYYGQKYTNCTPQERTLIKLGRK